MANFELLILSESDGTWDQFKTDWSAQCDQVGESFDDYAADALSIISKVVDGGIERVGGDSTTRAAALWDHDTSKFYACCMLNRARLPQTIGHTLRVRHLIVSPLLDYGVAAVEMYPDVVIGVMLGIVSHSESVLSARNIHMHLRSPEDMVFFRSFGHALNGAEIFESVQTRGSWLYIVKPGAVVAVPAEEAK